MIDAGTDCKSQCAAAAAAKQPGLVAVHQLEQLHMAAWGLKLQPPPGAQWLGHPFCPRPPIRRFSQPSL
eukprot:scaffold77112_cov18-Tisochrysis_lutea.AAC.4